MFDFLAPNDPSVIIECTSSASCTTTHAIISTAIIFITLLTGFAYTTLLERRFIAAIQSRVGPNRAGPFGLLQPVADGIKLIFKEEVIPTNADKPVYYLAPVMKVVPALIVLAAIPLGPKLVVPWFDGNWYRISQGLMDPNVGILWVLAVTSISVYGVTLAGWASNNKYAILGALRSSASMISYELSMGLTFAVPVMLAGSLSFGDIIEDQYGLFNWYVWRNPLAALLLWIAMMAEINRGPFDMPEAEQELVAGHMTEYSGMKFALFFMAEYINMIGISVIFSSLFLGGYDDGFGIVQGAPILAVPVLASKVVLFLMFMIWVRGTVFRFRYDRLMMFGWKVMLPLSMLSVVWTAVTVVVTDEGGGQVVQGISAGMLMILLGLFYYLLNRELTPATPTPGVKTEVLPNNRGFAFIILQMVGALIAIPFALVQFNKNMLAQLKGDSSEQEV